MMTRSVSVSSPSSDSVAGQCMRGGTEINPSESRSCGDTGVPTLASRSSRTLGVKLLQALNYLADKPRVVDEPPKMSGVTVAYKRDERLA